MLTLYDPGLIDNVTKTQHTTPHDPVKYVEYHNSPPIS